MAATIDLTEGRAVEIGHDGGDYTLTTLAADDLPCWSARGTRRARTEDEAVRLAVEMGATWGAAIDAVASVVRGNIERYAGLLSCRPAVAAWRRWLTDRAAAPTT